jgi:hypothetical protein
MLVFSSEGECGFSGILKTMTASKSLHKYVLNVPANATHYVHFTTGSVAELREGEVLTGGTSTATVLLVGKAIDNGTAAGTDEEGTLFVRILSGTPTAAGETWTGVSTGTVVTAQDPLPIRFFGQPKAALVTAETAAVNFTLDGTTPTATAGTNLGHQLSSGQSYVVNGWQNIRSFKAINSVNASGAILKYSMFY